MRKVDFLNEPSDFEVLILGSLGLSTTYISGVTGLTPGQVEYRLRLGGIKRSEYRNGRSKTAHSAMRLARSAATGVVKAGLATRRR